MAELVILAPIGLGLYFVTCFRAMAFLSGLFRGFCPGSVKGKNELPEADAT